MAALLPRMNPIACTFSSAAEVRAAAEFDRERVTLTLPAFVGVSRGESIAVQLTIGAGPAVQVTGAVERMSGAGMTVLFEGPHAHAVQDAIRRAEAGRRGSARHRCSMPVVVRIGSGDVRATAADVCTGGVGLCDLSRPLAVGAAVTVQFGAGSPQIPARVQWSGDRSRAGLCFAGDATLLVAIRRLVASAAALSQSPHPTQ